MTTKVKKETVESIKVTGTNLVQKVKQLVKEGNVRRISVVDKSGKTLIVLPLTVGVVGALLAFPLTALSVIAAMVTECTIKVERK